MWLDNSSPWDGAAYDHVTARCMPIAASVRPMRRTTSSMTACVTTRRVTTAGMTASAVATATAMLRKNGCGRKDDCSRASDNERGDMDSHGGPRFTFASTVVPSERGVFIGSKRQPQPLLNTPGDITVRSRRRTALAQAR